MPIALENPIVGLAGGDASRAVLGSGLARPGGLEYLIEYGGILFNNTRTVDKIRITEISGLDDADVRDAREQNPSYHGETAFDAWYGGRTITLTGRIEAYTLEKLRDMQMALRQAFSVLKEQPLIFRSHDGQRDTMIMCRKSAPLAMRESQDDMRFFRDFTVTLRASNPRFLDYSQQVVSGKIGASNLATNPKAGSLATTGWTPTSLAQWQAVNLGGSHPAPGGELPPGIGTAFRMVMDANLDRVHTDFPVQAGKTYRLSAYFFTQSSTSGGLGFQLFDAISGGTQLYLAEDPRLGAWHRHDLGAFTANENGTWRFTIRQIGDGNTTAYFTAVLIEDSPDLNSYFDGDSAGASWDGLPNASTSKRLKDVIARPVNYGNFRAQPLIRISGEVTDPSVVNLANGERIQLLGQITAGDHIDIDIEGRSIVNSSGVNKFGLFDMTSDWMELEPGENPLEFDAASSSGDPRLSVLFRNTWM